MLQLTYIIEAAKACLGKIEMYPLKYQEATAFRRWNIHSDSMKKSLLSLLMLVGCSSFTPDSTTAWERASYLEIDGIVEIATGWARAPLCTGSLIRKDMVLTAAHCAVFPAEDLYIVYGCDDIDDASCVRVHVKYNIVHPKWMVEFLSTNDKAILVQEKQILLKLAEISTKKDITEE